MSAIWCFIHFSACPSWFLILGHEFLLSAAPPQLDWLWRSEHFSRSVVTVTLEKKRSKDWFTNGTLNYAQLLGFLLSVSFFFSQFSEEKGPPSNKHWLFLPIGTSYFWEPLSISTSVFSPSYLKWIALSMPILKMLTGRNNWAYFKLCLFPLQTNVWKGIPRSIFSL